MKNKKAKAILTVYGISHMKESERKKLIKWIESQIKNIKADYKNSGFAKRYTARLF